MSSLTTFDSYLEPWLVARVPRMSQYSSKLAEFYEWVRTEVEAQANYTDRYAPPALETYDRNGEVINRIVANRQYDEQHAELYRRGIIGLPYSEGAPHLLTFAMGYLLSQSDISLHCPVTLTGAVAYVLGSHAPEAVRQKFLHDVVRMDGLAKTGGTWATEQHGGSDVGATTTVATPTNPPAAMSEAREMGRCVFLSGLKWFTSNANSGLAVATARPEGAPEGSAGLGLYLVPSHLEDGRPNHYRIRRLKDKLGTKGLPTGEIELLGAAAFEIAPPPHGFKLMMEALEYSRVHNAVGSVGVQRRALREALAWAKSRHAFGHVLAEYPMVQDELLRMRVEFEAGALLAFEAAITFDEVQRDPERRTWLRLSTALAKYLTAEYAIAGEPGGAGADRRKRLHQRLSGGAAAARCAGAHGVGGPGEHPGAGIAAAAESEVSRVGAVSGARAGYCKKLPESLNRLRLALEKRLRGDFQAVRITLRDQRSGQRHARKLLHRLSQTLAFALLCDAAREHHAKGDMSQTHSAWRYLEQIEPPKFGAENQPAREGVLQVLREEAGQARDK